MTTAHVRLMQVGGRELRVATWRLDMPSDHLPVLFFNGIGANIEAVAPLAEALDDRGFVMFDMPGVGGSPESTRGGSALPTRRADAPSTRSGRNAAGRAAEDE